jgi:chromatin segregation and condensation protein Rec8/ScpA/Scc1 (kleisin family)
VTDDFLKYLEALKTSGLLTAASQEAGVDVIQADLRVLADFISIASRLIFLKSK